MHSVCAGDKRFWGENDSQTNQNAVDFAKRTDEPLSVPSAYARYDEKGNLKK